MYLDKYVTYIKEQTQTMNLSETELIMYVYIDLAKRFKFNDDFFFGNLRTKRCIYNNAYEFDVLNDCMESNTIICKSSAKILEYVLTHLGVQIKTIVEENDFKQYKHVLNLIIPKDGSPIYTIDLQEDMSNIQFHGFTSNFGLDPINNTSVIKREEIRRIHKKIGYISENELYTDDYIYLFKMNLDKDMSLVDRLDVVLGNIEPYSCPDINYWERRWKHERMLEELFGTELNNKLHTIEFYKNEDGKIINNNGFYLHTRDGVFVYYYNKDNYRYDKYPISEFARKVLDEKIHYRQGIMGIRHEINKMYTKCKN